MKQEKKQSEKKGRDEILIRKVSPELRRAIKQRALDKDSNMNALILESLTADFLKKKGA